MYIPTAEQMFLNPNRVFRIGKSIHFTHACAYGKGTIAHILPLALTCCVDGGQRGKSCYVYFLQHSWHSADSVMHCATDCDAQDLLSFVCVCECDVQ